ncbi:DUF1707 SHOCT-like domain-containing protein [Actinomadura hibisca]|uniref:DUF1707 SHOCT-like domain-containing protein n=1 Tax=Actinomadura hibisca TaxID=68565 RepID=UPI000835A9F2|nr:DUF1707 domain-containing protein [Actinomadura hibisca]
MTVEQRPALRASDSDRDELLVRLHTAYAEGRLTEDELDGRIESALAARTQDELARLAADLPAARRPVPAAPAHGPSGARPAGRFQLAYKSTVRRTGRWRLPDVHTTVVYKGSGLLDLRAADLPGQVVTLRVVAYKSTVRIVVPEGVRVEISGVGVSAETHDAADDAPVVHVKGLAYKGTIEAIDHLHLA